ncbi:hypothetical protein V8F33_005375 [Rhypophila sp. PSN 637]
MARMYVPLTNLLVLAIQTCSIRIVSCSGRQEIQTTDRDVDISGWKKRGKTYSSHPALDNVMLFLVSPFYTARGQGTGDAPDTKIHTRGPSPAQHEWAAVYENRAILHIADPTSWRR